MMKDGKNEKKQEETLYYTGYSNFCYFDAAIIE
jgi:hypothetical protein